MKCREITQIIEKLCPIDLALGFDNPGLILGDFDKEINSVLVTLDVTDEVIDAAIDNHIDMIVAHHPIIFGKLAKINSDDVVGRRIIKAMSKDICVYAAHTNFDVKIMGGISASMLGLESPTPLEITAYSPEGTPLGIGMVSEVYESNAMVWIDKVKASFGLEQVIVYGNTDRNINKIAISPGSGKSMIGAALAVDADMLITGDIGHHEGIDAMEAGLIVVDASHYGLEQIFIDYMARIIDKECMDVRVVTSKSQIPYSIL